MIRTFHFIFAFLFCFLFFWPSINGSNTSLNAERESSKTEKYIITGVLQWESGSPAKEVTVFIFPYKDKKIISPIVHDKDGRFRLGCPGGNTDEKGKFVVKFSSNFLRKHETDKFVMGVFRIIGGPDPFKGEGPLDAIMIFGIDLFENSNKLDLSQIADKIVVSPSGLSPIEPSRDINKNKF